MKKHPHVFYLGQEESVDMPETFWIQLRGFLKNQFLLIRHPKRHVFYWEYLDMLWSSKNIGSSEAIYLIFEDNLLSENPVDFSYCSISEKHVSVWLRLTEKYEKYKDPTSLLNVSFDRFFFGAPYQKDLVKAKAFQIALEILTGPRKDSMNTCSVNKVFYQFDSDQKRIITEIILNFEPGVWSYEVISMTRDIDFSALLKSKVFSSHRCISVETKYLSKRATCREMQNILEYWKSKYGVNGRFISCFRLFQSIYPSEAIVYSSEVLSYIGIRINNGKQVEHKDIYCLLRLQLTDGSLGKELLQLILMDDSQISALLQFRWLHFDKDFDGSFTFEEISKLFTIFTKLNSGSNFETRSQETKHHRGKHLDKLGISKEEQILNSSYLMFLADRLSLLKFNIYLPKYFGYIRKHHRHLIKPLQTYFNEYFHYASNEDRYDVDCDFTLSQLRFISIFLNEDFHSNSELYEIFESDFSYILYAYLDTVWDELPDKMRETTTHRIAQEKVDVNNFYYLTDIVCKAVNHGAAIRQVFVDVFNYSRYPDDSRKFLIDEVVQGKMALFYRIQMAANIFFVVDFRQKMELYGVGVMIELCCA
jgi:hypothetical protein